MSLSVSLVTVTCGDDPSLLRACLDSVARQSKRPSRHVVVSGSPANAEIIRLYAENNEGVEIVNLPARGVYDAINRGLEKAGGDIVGLLHGNDRLAQDDVLEKVASAFEADAGIDFVYGDIRYSRPGRGKGRLYSGRGWEPGMLERGFMPPHPSLYLRRVVCDTLGPYDTAFPTAADFEYFLRLREGRHRGVYLPLVMVDMSPGGLSSRLANRLWKNAGEKKRALAKHGVEAGRLQLAGRYLHAFKDLFR